MGRIVEGYVERLGCGSCGSRFPHFTFSGDTDMATEGLMTVASAAANEVVLGEASADEWRDETGAAFAARANRELARTDLRAARLVSVTEAAPSRPGLSFAAFRQSYGPPVLTFGCPCCGASSAMAEAKFEPRAFEQSGGTITLLDGLQLRD